MTRYLNPWHESRSFRRTPQYFEHDGAQVGAVYRGVTIYRRPEGYYDFVFDGMCVTQRAGITEAIAVIDGILDGNDAYVCDTVAAHLREHGHKAKGYSDVVD